MISLIVTPAALACLENQYSVKISTEFCACEHAPSYWMETLEDEVMEDIYKMLLRRQQNLKTERELKIEEYQNFITHVSLYPCPVL